MIQPQSILIVRGGALGDFILTLPVLSNLRQAYPCAGLHILGRPSIAQLAVAGGLADSVRDLDASSLSGLFSPSGLVDQVWKLYFAQFDLILSFIYDPDGVFRENLKQLTSALYLQGIHRPQESQNLHAIDALITSLDRLSIPWTHRLPQLQIGNKEISPKPVIAFHPGSGSKSKNWPVYKWQELIQALLEKTTSNLLLIGGESDSNEVSRLLSHFHDPRILRAINYPLVALAEILQECQFYIGHDTGITHLAAALGVPSLVLWGPTLKRIWAPPHPHVIILEDPRGLIHLEAGSVLQIVLDSLPRCATTC